MTKTGWVVNMDRALAPLGLFLMLAIARLCGPAFDGSRTTAGRVSAFLARRAIDVVASVGWLVDRLAPPSAISPAAHARAERNGRCQPA